MCYSSDQIPQIEYPTMVPRKFEPLCQGASPDTKGKRNSNKSKSYCLSIDGWELIDTSGLVGFLKTFLRDWMLDNHFHIIMNYRQTSTLSNYESFS